LKTAGGSLSIEVWVNCPHCDNYLNILNQSHTDGYDHNDEGQILQQACPSKGHWTDAHEKFEIQEVTCSQCKIAFNVEGLDW